MVLLCSTLQRILLHGEIYYACQLLFRLIILTLSVISPMTVIASFPEIQIFFTSFQDGHFAFHGFIFSDFFSIRLTFNALTSAMNFSIFWVHLQEKKLTSAGIRLLDRSGLRSPTCFYILLICLLHLKTKDCMTNLNIFLSQPPPQLFLCHYLFHNICHCH